LWFILQFKLYLSLSNIFPKTNTEFNKQYFKNYIETGIFPETNFKYFENIFEKRYSADLDVNSNFSE
jgi:predicted AAA+ superfamily ATPase